MYICTHTYIQILECILEYFLALEKIHSRRQDEGYASTMIWKSQYACFIGDEDLGRNASLWYPPSPSASPLPTSTK